MRWLPSFCQARGLRFLNTGPENCCTACTRPFYVNGKNVNLEMVKAGLAEVYRGRPAKGFDNEPYQKAEDAARRAGRGMWSLEDKYVSPMDWRKIH